MIKHLNRLFSCQIVQGDKENRVNMQNIHFPFFDLHFYTIHKAMAGGKGKVSYGYSALQQVGKWTRILQCYIYFVQPHP